MKSSRAYFLTTPRLGFRHWSPDDLPLAHVLWGDPRVTALICAGGTLTPAEIAERLQRELENHTEHGLQYWPIFRRADHDFVGCCGLRPYRPAQRELEFGVHLRPVHWGAGIAFEAGTAVIGLAFATLGAAALIAGHHPENYVSRGMLLKLGFRYSHDALYPPTGLIHPWYRLSPASAKVVESETAVRPILPSN